MLNEPPANVQAVLKGYPAPARKKLLALRQLIFQTAAQTEGVGVVSETLKWNEPSYAAKAGTPIRIAYKAASPDHLGIYFHCQTDLISRFRDSLGDTFTFEGNRAILLPVSAPLPKDALRVCIRAALRYHRDKKATRVV